MMYRKGIQNLFRYIYIIFVFLFVHMCLSAIYAPLVRLRAVYSLSWEKYAPQRLRRLWSINFPIFDLYPDRFSPASFERISFAFDG